MDAKGHLALRWLLGHDKPHYEKVRDGQGGFVDQLISQAPGLNALIELLRSENPLPPDLRNALANALEPVGPSSVTLVLLPKRRSRGRPRNTVEQAVKLHEIAHGFEDREDKHPKTDVDVEEFAKAKRVSKSRTYKALATRKAARGIKRK